MLSWDIWKMTSNVKGSDPLQYLYYGEGSCNSADTKPTEGIYNGSKLVEMDTGNIYMFDQDSMSWVTTW